MNLIEQLAAPPPEPYSFASPNCFGFAFYSIQTMKVLWITYNLIKKVPIRH